MVFEHISALLSSPARFSDLLIERAVVGLLKLCLVIAEKVSHTFMLLDFDVFDHLEQQNKLRGELYVALDLLGGLPPPILNAVAEQLMEGVSAIVKGHPSIIR